MRTTLLLFLFVLLGVEDSQADSALAPSRVDRRPQLPGATTIAQFTCPAGSVQVYTGPSTIMCRCPDGSYAGMASGCTSAAQPNPPKTCMDSNANPDERIAACSAQLANPLGFGWTCNHLVQGQLQTKPCDEKGLSGIRGLLFNARGSAYKAKRDLKSAIADFQQAVASARFAGESRPNFERNLQQAQAESAGSAEYDRQYDQFVQQWHGCFSGAESVTEANRNILMCDFALSYQRIAPVDRDKLIQQRATLDGIKQAQLRQQEQQRQPQELPDPGEVTPAADTTEINLSFGWLVGFFRWLQVAMIFGGAAGVVVATLFIWILVSAASSTPIPVLKQRAVIAAWVAVPAAVGGALYMWTPAYRGALGWWVIGFLVLWTDVVAGLAIGGMARQRFLKREAAGVRSLPLVAVACTLVTLVAIELFIEHGFPGPSPNCESGPSLFSLCWFSRREGFLVGVLALALIATCGVVLPADSNIVLAYERLAARVRSSFADAVRSQERQNQREALTEAQSTAEPASTPAAMPAWLTETVAPNIPTPDPWSELVRVVGDSKEPQPRPAPMPAPAPEPARSEAQPRPESPPEVPPTPEPAPVVPNFLTTPPAPPAGAPPPPTPNLPAVMPQIPPAMTEIPQVGPPPPMQLKLKRTQRNGMLGKVIFVLDARMEISAEERGLIEKYRLGDNVIYDSTARKKYTEATGAHLERTREQVSFSDTPGAQLLGVGKSLYRLARAGVSATMASLSLRITVYSLMGGVHVECKSMIELLGAERAIREAAENLRTYLDLAATFDGQEEIHEF
jgi:hypothetical protein